MELDDIGKELSKVRSRRINHGIDAYELEEKVDDLASILHDLIIYIGSRVKD
jgi:hypothetical protein